MKPSHSSEQVIRHLVLWKMKECVTRQEKRETLELLKSRLERLPKIIKGILDFEVEISNMDTPSGADLSLLSTFASEAALTAYLVHPAHRDVVALLGEKTSAKLISDYPVESTTNPDPPSSILLPSP